MRSSRERQIKFMNSWGDRSFDDAVKAMIAIYGADFFTDDQIAEMTACTVEKRRRDLRFMLRNREAA